MGSTPVCSRASRLATRSVPGFLVVSGGLLAKAVVDRSLGRGAKRRARRAGSEDKQAENGQRRG